MTTINMRTGRKFRTRFLLGDDLIPRQIPPGARSGPNVTCVTPTLKTRAQRVATRLLGPPAVVLAGVDALQDPTPWVVAGGTAGAILGGRVALHAGRKARHWRHRRVYVRPLGRVIAQALQEDPNRVDRFLHVSPDLGGLAARLVRPMSPAEEAVRKFYGARISPVLNWAPEQGMRAYWWTHERTGTVRKAVDWFRVPAEAKPARVEITIRAGFATKEQRDLIRQAVVAKLGISDLIESWDQVGPVAVATFTVRERPPSSVGLVDIAPFLAQLGPAEFIIGLTTGGRPVIVSLDDDAPHIACSAGSGAGKSVLAKLIGSQVLARGGEVIILDRKGSHRWARGLKGVRYLTKPAEIHHALIELSVLANERNDQALQEEEGWVPGQRKLIIFEEMNATIAQLIAWWETNREKGDPKSSPAVQAFRDVMFMGRSAWVNLFGVAQLLTARTTGGPEARENFGVRCLARFTVNAWKMLAPECPVPKRSKTRGRWQVVVAGEATETQVAYLTDDEARELANVPVSPNSDNPSHQGERTGTTSGGDNFVSLRKFCNTHSLDFETIRKRRTRARAKGAGPRVCRVAGRTELYDPEDLQRWVTGEHITTEQESTNV